MGSRLGCLSAKTIEEVVTAAVRDCMNFRRGIFGMIFSLIDIPGVATVTVQIARDLVVVLILVLETHKPAHNDDENDDELSFPPLCFSALSQLNHPEPASFCYLRGTIRIRSS